MAGQELLLSTVPAEGAGSRLVIDRDDLAIGHGEHAVGGRHQERWSDVDEIPDLSGQLRQVLERWPDHTYGPASIYYIGWIYFLCMRDTSQQAIDAFRELLERYPYESYADSIEYWLDALQQTAPEPKAWWEQYPEPPPAGGDAPKG